MLRPQYVSIEKNILDYVKFTDHFVIEMTYGIQYNKHNEISPSDIR